MQGIDDFLASALKPSAANLSATFKFAELEAHQVPDVMVVIPAEIVNGKFSVDTDTLSGFRGEIQNWLRALREQGQLVTEMLSASVRDQSVRQIVFKLLDAAYCSPTQSWMTTLPTGRQLVIAPSRVVNAVGFDALCRIAHEKAIRTAQAHGQPYNSQALSLYQAARPSQAS